MCGGGVGEDHSLFVNGEWRCFSLWVPPVAAPPAPVVIMHHGRDSGAGQLCNHFATDQAQEHGFALLCTQAVGGNWRFGGLPWWEGGDGFGKGSSVYSNACSDSDSNDLAYVRQVYAYLHQWPAFDAQRIYHVGFSQGALFAACMTTREPNM